MASGNGDRRSLTAYELWYGRDEPPPDRTSLRAGPLSALWEGGDLRGVRLADVEILRRVYVSARDENWDTIPARLTNLSTDVRNDRFIITYDAETSSRNLELRWHAVLAGESDGTITLSYGWPGDTRFPVLPHRLLPVAPARRVLRTTLYWDWPGRSDKREFAHLRRSSTL